MAIKRVANATNGRKRNSLTENALNYPRNNINNQFRPLIKRLNPQLTEECEQIVKHARKYETMRGKCGTGSKKQNYNRDESEVLRIRVVLQTFKRISSWESTAPI